MTSAQNFFWHFLYFHWDFSYYCISICFHWTEQCNLFLAWLFQSWLKALLVGSIGCHNKAMCGGQFRKESLVGKYHINLNQSESIWINLKQLLDRAVGQHGRTPSHTFLSSEHEGSDCLSIHLPVHHAHSVLPSLRNRPIGCAMFLKATHLHKLDWLQWCSKEGIYTPTPELQHQDWWRKQHTGT